VEPRLFSQAQFTRTSAPSAGVIASTVVGATMTMPFLTKMGVIASTTALTITTPLTQPEMRTFVPPFTAGVLVSTSVPTSRNP
jgi:hypothetical protein